ncbi:carboxypeptidase-like regulatory domain-containing protein [Chitinophaga sp. S165]|uniref:carboxypeptidase-like regulatory domain-containing protein n=1 Tax=Chitinophaga sp. S165 TaxID=2135462 RepID=UPI000D8E1006|nr:carboxypeptidase-like regulatory domain-containing protein [Chitinophaga sp. S165]PWV56648.1 alpha-2-macroglobulin family protein [Chitinophaga sp. S165]
MKKLALLLLLLSSFTASAQHPLSQGRRTSVYEYLYELSNEEALEISSHGAGKINTSLLHTLKDSFPHDKGVPANIPPGNYLRVYAQNDQLQTVFLQVPNVYVKLADNNHDLVVILHDQKGNLIKDAKIKIGRHTLGFDASSSAWLLSKYERPGLLQVYYKGMLNCIPLTRDGYYYKVNPLRRIKRKIIIAGSKLWGSRRDYYNNWYNPSPYEREYRGYMVFSKPIYKPGDTLKVKAYVTDRKGKPVDKPLLLRISDRDYSTDTILTTLSPYSPGGYSYEVVLTPDLGLLLDDDYMITLETTDSRKYDLSTYEGDLDEDEYVAKRKILVRGKFELEEYELHTLTFNARSDKALHTSRETAAVYLQAKDENDLPVMDGQIQLYLTKPVVKKSYSEDLLVPDTLWRYSGPVDVIGETKVTIPDSIFPKADLFYQIECILTTSNNERKTDRLSQEYRYDRGRFTFNMQADSLYIASGGGGTNDKVRIYALNEGHDTIDTYVKVLPAAIKINPLVSSYEVQGKNEKDSYTLTSDPDFISCKTDWRNDTVTVHVDNPHKQFFWYTISGQGKIMLRGYGDTLTWQASTLHNKQYKLHVSYIWKGTMHNVPLAFKDPGGKLNITVDAPRTVYPGQTTQITVNVRDKYQQPVEHADVTSYAYTSKFTDDHVPAIPFFTTPYKREKFYQLLKTLPTPNGARPMPIEWERYGRRMGLDSLLFFRFTHPSPVFTYTEPTEDLSAQIAPFVIARGSIQPVHILYVDEVPVYYSMTSPVQPYSIRVSPGKHKISLRTAYQQITMEQVIADRVKTFISIDSAIHQVNVSVQAMPQQLTPLETSRADRYMLRLINTFGGHSAYIRHQNRLYDLDADGLRKSSYYYYTVGPLTGINATLVAKDYFSQDFTPEAGYSFEINHGLIKQKEIKPWPYYNLDHYRPDTSLSALALTEKSIDSTLRAQQDDKLRNENVIPLTRDQKTYRSRLSIRIDNPDINPATDVLGFLFFRYDEPAYVKSFKGLTTDFQYLESGYYKLLVLLTHSRYFTKDSILLKDDHQHYYTFDTVSIQKQDTPVIRLERQLRETASYGYINWNIYARKREIAEGFNTDLIHPSQLTRVVSGKVVDANGDPLPGVSILLRGSKSGTSTDAAGNFTLHVTPKGTLSIRYIGFESLDQPLTNDDFYTITLTENTKALQEVVVTALGVRREQKSLGYAVSTITSEQIAAAGATNFASALYGKAAGVKITTAPGAMGYTPATFDGNDLATEGAADTDQLPTPPANSLRTNFRDDAFWQPRLRTDAHGNASFNVTFPDDITNWKTYTIAMNGKQQSGVNRMFIRSYKALSGNLALPLFAVEGDSLLAISKALNYTQDTIAATHSFYVNDSLYKTANISFKNAFIDSVPVMISAGDSVSFRYTVNKAGYMDGEQRKIPVVRRGTEETSGMFAALYNDTSFTYMPQHPEPLQLHAESAILPVLMDEIAQVQRYKYLCNEQLASKLKAFLLEKKLSAYLKKDFKKEDDIKTILLKLDRQKKSGLWGWWENSPVSVWISRHVIEALLMAEDQGYKTGFNKQVAIDYFVDGLNSGKEHDSIRCMELLIDLEAKIDYHAFIDSIIARSGRSGYDTIRLAILQRRVGIPVNLSPILAGEKSTVFGNAYWGSESYHLFDNSIQKTLQVYKLLRKAGGYEQLLQKIRGYFLEQRKDGHWRNTYESALILETILPDVLEDESHGPAAIDINGRHITRFPYTDTLTHTEKINISKQGKRPVYFTAYQQFFNTQPEKVSGLFNVSSVFSVNGTTQTDLKAGVPVTLKVEVKVQKTADYVLIEIPIPAGCSYNDKSQAWANNEVHREHFKDRVSIFCSQLSPGTHTFNVSLLPRYSGSYHLNPAKAEMQYFPVFMGREALKKVNIH